MQRFVRASLFVFLILPVLAQAQLSGIDRERAQGMLKNVATDIRKHYYDPKFHGIDWDAKVAETKTKIDNAKSFNVALSHVAGLMDQLNDSHTFFVPPSRPFRHDYGYRAQMFGDHCFITRIRPKTDAEAKGLKPGDEILAIEGFNVTPADFWKMQYVYNILRPQGSLRLTLKDATGNERDVQIAAKIRQTKLITDLRGGEADNEIWNMVRESQNQENSLRARYAELDGDVMVLRLPEFYFSENEVEGVIDIARKHKGLIIDLRGNPGGSVDSLRYLVGSVFDHEIKIADLSGRERNQPQISKFNYRKSYSGKLTVLIDSRSASAAELFARVMQLQKRGSVEGDLSSGSVMESKEYSYEVGAGTVVFFGASITDADVIMTDGKSLEHVGVTPDKMVDPTPDELSKSLDPVLSKAVQELGGQLSPEAAWKLFPYEWPSE